jgi:hypothetical protein
MTRDLTQRFQSTAEFIRALDSWTQSGAAVSVPPAADGVAAGLAYAGSPGGSRAGHTGMGSQANLNRSGAATGPGTSGNWASSQPDGAPALPKKSNAGLIAALAVVGIVVMGGAAFAAYSVLGKKADPLAGGSASSHPPSVPAAAAEAKIELAPPPAAVAAAPGAAAPPAASAAADTAAPIASDSAKPTAGSAALAGRPVAPTAPLTRAPGGAPKPAPATTTKPGAPAAAKPPAGAKPGGTPDFGY